METSAATKTTPSFGRETEINGQRMRAYTFVKSHSTLKDELYLYILGILAVFWLAIQLRRVKARKPLDAGCWYGWDALGMAVVALHAQQQRWVLACIFTSSFFVWTRLPGSPLNDFRLPSFGTFLERASKQQRVHSAGDRSTAKSTDASEDELEQSCLVCWSSDEIPATLPCNHLVCRECLTTMKDRRQTCCPLCRRLLFHNNDGMRCAIHKAVVAAFAARLTVSAILYLLQLLDEHYWNVGKSALAYFPQLYCFRHLYRVTFMQGVEWWQYGLFDYLLPLPADARFFRSVGPPLIFTLLFISGIWVDMLHIARLDLSVNRITRFYDI